MTGRDESGRSREHRDWVVRKYALGADVADDPGRTLSVQERIALVWTLSARMWELTGRPLPNYSRAEMPTAVVRRQ